MPTVASYGREDGQSLLLLIGVLTPALAGALVLGAVARGVGAHWGNEQAVRR